MTFRLPILITTFFDRVSRRQKTRSLQRVLEAGRVLVDPAADESQAAYWTLRTEAPTSNESNEVGLALAQKRYLNRVRRDRDRLGLAVASKRDFEEAGDTMVVSRPLQHFLELSGCDPAEIPELQTPSARRKKRSEARPNVPFRSDRTPRVWKQAGSSLMMASLVLYVVTLGLNASDPLVKSVLSESQSQAVSWYMLGQTSRGTDAAWQREVRVGYLEAFSMLNDSRTSILGQFPGYDRGELTLATNRMASVVEFQRLREPASSRILILLAGLFVTLDREDEALPILEDVVQRNDDESARARTLLVSIRGASRVSRHR